MNRKKSLGILVTWVTFASVSSAHAATITFDELGSQPSAFSLADPLQEEYASMGVHFTGLAPLDGGAILDESSAFGVPALSGDNFLAFNVNALMQNGGIPTGPEIIRFDFPVSSVSIWGGDRTVTTFTLTAFDINDNLLGTDIRSNTGGDYIELSIVASPGTNIRSITLDADDDHYVYDDLTFERSPVGVPESGATLAFLGCGLISLASARRWVK